MLLLLLPLDCLTMPAATAHRSACLTSLPACPNYCAERLYKKHVESVAFSGHGAVPGRVLENAGPEPLPANAAMALAVVPGMRQRERMAQDARISAKEADDVLEVVRQQAYAMRRWIISAQPSQLHGLIRIYCYVRTPDTATLRRAVPPGSMRFRG